MEKLEIEIPQDTYNNLSQLARRKNTEVEQVARQILDLGVRIVKVSLFFMDDQGGTHTD